MSIAGGRGEMNGHGTRRGTESCQPTTSNSHEEEEEEENKVYFDLPAPPPQTALNRRLMLRSNALKNVWSKSPYKLTSEEVREKGKFREKFKRLRLCTTLNPEHFPEELFSRNSRARTREISRISQDDTKTLDNLRDLSRGADALVEKLAMAEEMEERYKNENGKASKEMDGAAQNGNGVAVKVKVEPNGEREPGSRKRKGSDPSAEDVKAEPGEAEEDEDDEEDDDFYDDEAYGNFDDDDDADPYDDGDEEGAFY